MGTKKLYRNMRLFTPVDGGHPLAGKEQANVKEIKKAAMLVSGGIIEKIGEEEEILKNVCPCEVAIEKDFGGACVIPGFVDPHTHMCFAKRREDEFGMRLAGLPYLEILARGGGILSSVNAVKAATEEQLFETTKKLALAALAKGTTTVEIKSGYGLELGLELKMLEVIGRVGRETPLDVVPTFMGAHAVPQEYKGRADEFVDEVLVKQMLPKVKEQGIAEFCDVFCEEGVFTARESRTILEAGLAHGLRPKVHADEIAAIGGSQLAGEIGAISAEHLIVCPPEGIRSLAAGGAVACCLPATSFYLGAAYAPAREMIGAGVPVAVATDFNPGSCPGSSLQLAMNIACLKYRMTPEEVLTAVTLNAAAAIGRAGTIGSVEPGKQADLLLWNAPDLDYVCYRFGSNLVGTVMKKGRIVHEE